MADNNYKLSFRTKAAYGLAAFSEGMVVMPMAFCLMIFYTDVVGLDPRLVGWALLVGRLWDAVSDPLMGQISDRTYSRWGRRRPYLLFGAVPLGVSFLLFWTASPDLPTWGKFVLLMFGSLLWNTMHTLVVMPYWSLGAELSTDYDERTSVTTYRQFFTFLGWFPGAFAYQFAWGFADIVHNTVDWLTSSWGWTPKPSTAAFVERLASVRAGHVAMAIICGIILSVTFLASFFGTREEPVVRGRGHMPTLRGFLATLRNKPFLLMTIPLFVVVWAFSFAGGFWPYIVRYVLITEKWMTWYLLLLTASSVVFCPFYLAVSRLVGKKYAFSLNIFLYFLLHTSAYFVIRPDKPAWSLVYCCFCGVGLGGWAAIGSSIMADIIDVDELATGKRREGAYFGLQNLLIKTAGAVATVTIGYILNWTSYVPNEVQQSATTVLRLRFCYSLFPAAVFIVTGLFFFFTFPLTRQKVEKVRTELDRRAVARSDGPVPAIDVE